MPSIMRESTRLPISRRIRGSRGTSGTKWRSGIFRTWSAGIEQSALGPRWLAGWQCPHERRATGSSGDAGAPDAADECRGGGDGGRAGKTGQRPQFLAAALQYDEIAGIFAVGHVHIADLDLHEIEEHFDGPSGQTHLILHGERESLHSLVVISFSDLSLHCRETNPADSSRLCRFRVSKWLPGRSAGWPGPRSWLTRCEGARGL